MQYGYLTTDYVVGGSHACYRATNGFCDDQYHFDYPTEERMVISKVSSDFKQELKLIYPIYKNSKLNEFGFSIKKAINN
jgi:hypothetical protein